MQGTSEERSIYDIRDSVLSNKDIVSFLIAAHALSGCDTVAQFHGVGKLSILKRFSDGKKLSSLECCNANMNDVFAEATRFISDCYGFPDESMTKCRIKCWQSKNSKARKTTPSLKSLPPTEEAFGENVKKAHHIQGLVWYSALSTDPPTIDPTQYGWTRDEFDKQLVPVGLPCGVAAAPEEVLNAIKCTCQSSSPCKSARCSCTAV